MDHNGFERQTRHFPATIKINQTNPACVTWLCKVFSLSSGGVRTLIALHQGRKTKNKSFATCRSRVNISGSSKIAWINVEFNGNSLSVAVPSKFKSVCGTVQTLLFLLDKSLFGGNWRDSERIETAVLPENLFIWQRLHTQPMAVWIISNSRVI